MNQARLQGPTRKNLWAECANHCTILENAMASECSRVEGPWTDKKKTQSMLDNLKVFRELGVVKTVKDIQAKMINKGEPMMFVGLDT